ncbi:Putative transposase of IS4/5 family [Geodermatophilus amargosae]|uniref:Putative transposase of IS4/5 family n=1 Tax=Geodermatophilus amargosae TaxID=1296565 RepID=A0A1I7C8G0_9ACTN|nr:Putative transposase of IS4/5 family [Geodermatophilus amargosae]
MQDRHDLTDEQWAVLEPLLPDRTPRRGGRWGDHRPVVDGVLWRTRTGAPWRDLPPAYGHWQTVGTAPLELTRFGRGDQAA